MTTRTSTTNRICPNCNGVGKKRQLHKLLPAVVLLVVLGAFEGRAFVDFTGWAEAVLSLLVTALYIVALAFFYEATKMKPCLACHGAGKVSETTTETTDQSPPSP